MKILHINCVYKKGSTGKIVYDIHDKLLENKIESVVCYGRGEKINEPFIYKAGSEFLMKIQSLRSRLTGFVYGGCIISTYNIITLIKKEKPDIVHLHCINAYMVNIYKLLTFLKNQNIQTVLTLHAEFIHTSGCVHASDCEQWKVGCCKSGMTCPEYNGQRPTSWIFNRCNAEWNKMADAFDGFNNLVICPVSDWLRDRAKQSPFLSDKKFITVTNGLDTTIFKFTENNSIRENHKIRDEQIILYVTPNFYSSIKGGSYVLDLAKRMISDNVKFIIVGFNGDVSTLPPNIIPISHTNNQAELAEYYSMADITLLTSKKETFSMICAESLCCGTPIVGFEAGAPETISIPEYSEFVEQGNINLLENVVRKWLCIEYSKKIISNYAVQLYNKDIMFQKYKEIYMRENK